MMKWQWSWLAWLTRTTSPLLVMYLLLMGPVYCALPRALQCVGDPDFGYDAVDIFIDMYAPVLWLSDQSVPTQAAMSSYLSLWL
jgi:hypothetical protein